VKISAAVKDGDEMRERQRQNKRGFNSSGLPPAHILKNSVAISLLLVSKCLVEKRDTRRPPRWSRTSNTVRPALPHKFFYLQEIYSNSRAPAPDL
jgi:hypothetical protein